ncbi:MAG TPA: hypothetical protein VGK00_13465 [Anaerolineales bacterium]|jgi:hypothetical protein
MDPKTVLIWGGDDLLSSSIELYLASRSDWTVINIDKQAGCKALETALESTQAGIVIIRLEDQPTPDNISISLMQNHPALKVITVGLDNNSLEVYCKQKVLVRQPSDLISVIENEV